MAVTAPQASGAARSARARPATGTAFTRALGVATLAAMGLTALLGLAVSPADRQQGDAVRILYVHVPTAWLAYLAFITTAVASALYLWGKSHSLTFDRIAGASAEVGVLFMAFTLLAGSLWGRITWGTYWEWDARLTSTAFLFVTYIGYLAVRNLGGAHHQRARRSAALALLGVLEIPLVHFSVRLWRSLHQEATVARPNGDVKMDGLMLFTLFLANVAFLLAFVWLVVHRQRVLALQDAVDDSGLERALAERRREATI